MADQQPNAAQHGGRVSSFSFKAIFIALYHVFVTCRYSNIPSVEDFCWDVVRKYIREHLGVVDGMGFNYSQSGLILTSSNYAIAANHLGLVVDPMMKAYSESRGGGRYYMPIYQRINAGVSTPTEFFEGDYITFRDMIHTLELMHRLQTMISSIADLIAF